MKKYYKVIAIVITLAMLLTSLAACTKKDRNNNGKTTPAPTSAESSNSKELLVWSHLRPEEIKAIDEQIVQKWAKENNVKVKFLEDKGKFQDYLTAAQSSRAPDLMFGYPHNDLGTFQSAGLLAEVPKDLLNESDYTSKSILNAVKWDNKYYAVPLAAETVALFYRKDKVSEPPKTIEEFVEKAKEVGFKYDVNNFYFNYGWITGFGGYVFKENDGVYDPSDIGLGNEGAIKAYAWIQKLVTEHKLMMPDVKGDMAKAEFNAGNIGFYVSGPWDVADIKKAKVDLGVTPLPEVDGNKPRPFMGIQTGFVSSKTKNSELAWKLMKHLMTEAPKLIITVGNRLPILNADLEKDFVKNDPIIKAFSEQAQVAEPMPNIKQMSAVWTPAENNLKLLTAGNQDPETAAKNLVEQIKTGIAQQK